MNILEVCRRQPLLTNLEREIRSDLERGGEETLCLMKCFDMPWEQFEMLAPHGHRESALRLASALVRGVVHDIMLEWEAEV